MSDPVTGLPYNLAEYGKRRHSRKSFQEGYVTLKPNGMWEGHYKVPARQPDGTTKWKNRDKVFAAKADVPTKAQARQLWREWLRAHFEQPAADTPRATFRSLAEDFFALNSENWGEEWGVTIRGMFNSVLYPAFGDEPIENITAERLKRFINSLPDRTWYTVKFVKRNGVVVREQGVRHIGISKSYVEKINHKLRKIFGLALHRRLIPTNPADDYEIKLRVPRRAGEREKPVLEPAEFHRLLAELSPRDRLIAWILMLGGLRPNELFAQYRRNVGMDRFYIERALSRKRKLKAPKNNKPREVLLPTRLRIELQEWIASNRIGPDDLLFTNTEGGFINRANFLKRNLRPAAARAGITTTVDLRMLRRSFSTHFFALTKDTKSTQAQMGHARPDLTLGVYAQDVDPERAAGLERFERVMRGDEPWPREVLEKLLSKGVLVSEEAVGVIQ